MELTPLTTQAVIEELAGAEPGEAAPWASARYGGSPDDLMAWVREGDEIGAMRLCRAEAGYMRVCGQVVSAIWQFEQALERADELHASLPALAYAIMKSPPHKRPGIFKSRPSARGALDGLRGQFAEEVGKATAARETLRSAIPGARTAQAQEEALWAAREALAPVAAELGGLLEGAVMARDTLEFVADPENRADPGL